MSKSAVIASYLRIASDDLKATRLLVGASDRNAVYLCSQAAEKVIRAVLTSEDVHGGVGHQLESLISKIPDENPMKSAFAVLAPLGEFATSFRYPTTAGRVRSAPTKLQFEEHIKNVSMALDELARRFEVDLNEASSPAKKADPIR